MSSKYTNQSYLDYNKASINDLPCNDVLEFQVFLLLFLKHQFLKKDSFYFQA
jgi:hypothetical protein